MTSPVAALKRELGGDKPRRGRPRAEDKDAIPELIVEAALGLFKQQGIDATSIEQIAAVASASKATIYRHFGTKEVLAEAAVKRDADRVMEAVDAIAAETVHDDPVERLRLLCHGLAFFTSRSDTAALYRFSLAAVPRIPGVGLAFNDAATNVQNFLVPLVETAQASGQLRAMDAEILARYLYNSVVNPVWTDALVMVPYVQDDALRTAAVDSSWALFLSGARA